MSSNPPILIGLCGRAGTGKTSTALNIVPNYQVKTEEHALWDHLFLAMPLYEMASIRTDISGQMAHDRQRYEIHRVLTDLLGKSPLWGAPGYDDLVELVNQIASMPIERRGKPRSFLRDVGELCRSHKKDCFVEWIWATSIRRSHENRTDVEDPLLYNVIISDVRFPNEAAGIKKHDGVVVKFEASPEVRHERLEKRDGTDINLEDIDNHPSEMAVDQIDSNHIDFTVNTDNLSVEEQAEETQRIIREALGY